LRDIVLREFAPYDPSRFQIGGDDIDCPYAIAIQLALIVHELTTNAVKYGALSGPSGRISVVWSNAAGRLTLEWVETGGPQPATLTRVGFGSKLLRAGALVARPNENKSDDYHHGVVPCTNGLRLVRR
jgi:two-component sensor histidine kinase